MLGTKNAREKVLINRVGLLWCEKNEVTRFLYVTSF